MSLTKRILLPIIILLLATITFIFAFSAEKENKKAQLALKSYKNTVALYCDNEIIVTYDEIVLNTLPEYDKKRFKEGIIIKSVQEADKYLEDYE